MKRSSLIVASLLLALSGCTSGQGYNCSRPNIFQRMYQSIHGHDDVGAPCASGRCNVAPVYAAPLAATQPCDPCGPMGATTSMGYENYPGYEGGVVNEGYDSTIVESPYTSPTVAPRMEGVNGIPAGR